MPLLTGTDEADNLIGTSENDTLAGGRGADTLSGGLGDDYLWGGALDDYTGQNTGDDRLFGGSGSDFISAGDGADTIDGASERDFIFGGRGADSIAGGEGNDEISADFGDVFVDGGDGADRITISAAPTGETQRLARVDGGAGDDRISLFTAPTGRLVVDGGSGINTLSLLGSSVDTVQLYLNQPRDGDVVVVLGVTSVEVGDYQTSSGIVSARVFASDGAETITTRGVNDYIEGGGGNDVLTDNQSGFGPGAPQESIFGGTGDDRIFAGGGSHYLRGDEGGDQITGGSGFDDINGNMGADTLDGRFGDDWVVGGKDNDQVDGGDGADLVYGNLGNDFCSGGDGNDTVRGGQDDDRLSGGNGDDFLSGDRGADTVFGGSGADIFHAFQDSGIDRVKDFSQVQGDRVLLDASATYTVSQAGADTVIDFGGGSQMILEGVALATLRDGWLSGGASSPPPPLPNGPPTALAGFAPANMVAWAYDPTRGLVYVASTDGLVRSWDFLTNTSRTVTNLGGKPSSLAITPDGRYLIVGDSETVVPPGGPSGFNDPRQGSLTRFDLQTGASTKLTVTVSNGERGVTDVAVTSDGQVYVNHGITALSFYVFSSFDAAAATPTLARALAPYSLDRNMALSVSETGRYLMSLDTGSSSGGFLVVDSTTDQLVPTSGGNSPVRNFNYGTGDISEAAGQIVHVQPGGLYVWNLASTITFAKDLSALNLSGDNISASSTGRVLGAHFSANGQFLYLWDNYQDSILAVDRSTWTVVGIVQVKADATYDYFSTHQGEMDLTPDGRYLILDTGKSLEVIDLAVQLSIRQTGTDASERLNGDVGNDTLVGAGGADTLVGYGGNDVLTGGAGADVFRATNRGGFDRVTDFSVAAGDRVELAPGTTYALAQVGADVVITMGGGAMTLVGVQMSSLTPGWIFGS